MHTVLWTRYSFLIPPHALGVLRRYYHRLAPGSMFGNESPPECCVRSSSSNLVKNYLFYSDLILRVDAIDLEEFRSARELRVELLQPGLFQLVH
jgi:hypothetical protein